MSAGYSGAPLAKKLGIAAGTTVYATGAPANYRTLLTPLPEGARLVSRFSNVTDVAHLFVTRRTRLAAALPRLRKKMRSDAAIWVSWPKKSSGIATEVTEDTIRELAFPLGLVDVKVCAVDDAWSGLKLVVRKTLR